MKRTAITNQDTAVFSKTMQALLQAALAPDNFEPFLKKIMGIMLSPGGLGRKAGLAVILDGENGSQRVAYFCNLPVAERRRLLAGRKKTASGQSICVEIRPGGAKAGRVIAVPGPKAGKAAAASLVETAAKIVAARFAGEKRDAALAFERNLSSSLKHIEELYLSFPGISIEEISRAVLDEARRLTRSDFGFVGCLDQASGSLQVAALTRDAGPGSAPHGRPVVLDQLAGLPAWVIRHKRALLTNSAETDRRMIKLPANHARISRFLGAPAISGRKLLGMLALANPAADYGPQDLETAQKLARVYAMILQRKAVEDRQKEEDSRFKAIVSSTLDVIYTVSLEGRITYVSPRALDYGYNPEELEGMHVTELGHPEDREFLAKAFANAVKTGRTLPILPYRVRKKDGSYAYVEQKSGIVFHGGQPAYVTGVIRDVTEQKKTELRLKESEALMRMVFDTAKDAMFVKDMNGMYVKANKACADLMNTTAQEMIGRTDSDYFPPDAAEGVFRTDSEVVRTGRTLSLNNLHPFPGGARYVNIIKTPLKNAAGETIGLLGVARDITDLKRMEGELALAHAAEAVSKVARPMAHDFNNALAAINGYATLIEDDLPPSSPIKTEISRIIEAVKRAAELTSKFQDFARNPKIENPGEPGDKKEEKK